MVADEAPRLFAVVQEYGERVDGQIAAWGMAFADHAEVVSVKRGMRMSLQAPEKALRMFTFIGEYSRCGWRGEYTFKLIDQLVELVDTVQARLEVEDFLVRATDFIRHYVAANVEAPGVEKILAGVGKIPAAYRRARNFESLFKEQLGVPIRTFCGEQRLYLAATAAARHSISFARESLRYTCANFNHAFSRGFGVCPSAAFDFSDKVMGRA
jgi:hypothetical protein